MRFLSALQGLALLITTAWAQVPLATWTINDAMGNPTNAASYRSFLHNLREKAGNSPQLGLGGTFKSHNLPVCVAQPSNLVFDIVLTGEHNVQLRLRLRRDNLFIIGFRDEANQNANAWFELERTNTPLSIQGATALGYSGSYGDLERAAGENREDSTLGFSALKKAVNNLGSVPAGTDQGKERAHHILVLIQMISEATRFRALEAEFTEKNAWAIGKPPSRQAIEYETSWGALSTVLLRADKWGGEVPSIPENPILKIKNIDQIVAALGICLRSTDVDTSPEEWKKKKSGAASSAATTTTNNHRRSVSDGGEVVKRGDDAEMPKLRARRAISWVA